MVSRGLIDIPGLVAASDTARQPTGEAPVLDVSPVECSLSALRPLSLCLVETACSAPVLGDRYRLLAASSRSSSQSTRFGAAASSAKPTLVQKLVHTSGLPVRMHSTTWEATCSGVCTQPRGL